MDVSQAWTPRLLPAGHVLEHAPLALGVRDVIARSPIGLERYGPRESHADGVFR